MAITLTIDGNTLALLARSLRIVDQPRTATKCTLTARYVSGPSPAQGDEVAVDQDGTRLFTGVVLKAERRDEVHGNRVLIDVLAEDYFRNFRRVRIARTWESETLEDIIDDIVAEVPGVTKHPSQSTGPTLDHARSNHRMADKLVRGLADATERLYYVDEQKRFRMHTLTGVAAPAQLTSGAGSIAIGDISYDVDDSEYVNKVTVVGNLRPLEERTDSFEGDGSTRVFDLSFEPFDTPVIEVNGEEQDVSSTDNDAPWNAAPYEIEIEQRSSETVLQGPGLWIFDSSGDELFSTSVTDPSGATLIGTVGVTQPRGACFHVDGYLYIISNLPDKLWRMKNPRDTSTLEDLGALRSGISVSLPEGLASLNGNLYFIDSGSGSLYEITEPENPGGTGTTEKSHPPSSLDPISWTGLTEHSDNLFATDRIGGRLIRISDVDGTPSWSAVGDFPSGLAIPVGVASDGAHLYTVDSGSPDELWRFLPTNPGGATKVGDLPSDLSSPISIAYGGVAAIAATYRPFVPVIATAEDSAGQTANGVYERSFHAGNVTPEEAQETADVHLRRYGTLTHHIGFRTRTLGFRTGQSLTVNLATPAVAGTFVIDSVRYFDADGKTILGEVKASDAEGDDDWRELWKDDTSGEYVDSTPVYDASGNKL